MLPNGFVHTFLHTIPFRPQEELDNHRLPHWIRAHICLMVEKMHVAYRQAAEKGGTAGVPESRMTIFFDISDFLNKSYLPFWG